MTPKDAIYAMIDGEKVYRKSWKNDYCDYFYFDGECFRDEQDVLLMCDFHGADWEIYEEPKPKQTVVIEEWLCSTKKGLTIKLGDSAYFYSHSNLKKVKLLDTYEFEL